MQTKKKQEMEKGRILKMQAQKKAQSRSNERLGCWVGILVSGFLGIMFLAVGITLLVSHGQFSLKNILLGAVFAVLTVVLLKVRPRKTKTTASGAASDGSVELEDVGEAYSYIDGDSGTDIDGD